VCPLYVVVVRCGAVCCGVVWIISSVSFVCLYVRVFLLREQSFLFKRQLSARGLTNIPPFTYIWYVSVIFGSARSVYIRHMCMYICIYICVYICINIYIYVYIFVYIFVYLFVYIIV